MFLVYGTKLKYLEKEARSWTDTTSCSKTTVLTNCATVEPFAGYYIINLTWNSLWKWHNHKKIIDQHLLQNISFLELTRTRTNLMLYILKEKLKGRTPEEYRTHLFKFVMKATLIFLMLSSVYVLGWLSTNYHSHVYAIFKVLHYFWTFSLPWPAAP